jgi:hypothetical protein
MAVPFIRLPREHHPGSTSPAAYRRVHEGFMARRASSGARFSVHEDDTPLEARVEDNSWMVDCVCGNGCAADPAWALACCFGCGAVYTAVVFPDPVVLAQIDAVLVARPVTRTREWWPGEEVADLVAENEVHQVPVPDVEAIARDVQARLTAAAAPGPLGRLI